MSAKEILIPRFSIYNDEYELYESVAEFLCLTDKLVRGKREVKANRVPIFVLKELCSVKKLHYACIQDLFTSLRDAAFSYDVSTDKQGDVRRSYLFNQGSTEEWGKKKTELKKLIKNHLDPVLKLREIQKRCWESKVKLNEYASMLEAAQISLQYNSEDKNEYRARVMAIKGLKKDLASKQRRHTRNLRAYEEIFEIENKIRTDIIEIADSLKREITERVKGKLQEALHKLRSVTSLTIDFDPALISSSIYDLTSRVYRFDEATIEASSNPIMRPSSEESEYDSTSNHATYAQCDSLATVTDECLDLTENHLKLKPGDKVTLKMINRGGKTGFGWIKQSRFSNKRWGFFSTNRLSFD